MRSGHGHEVLTFCPASAYCWCYERASSDTKVDGDIEDRFQRVHCIHSLTYIPPYVRMLLLIFTVLLRVSRHRNHLSCRQWNMNFLHFHFRGPFESLRCRIYTFSIGTTYIKDQVFPAGTVHYRFYVIKHMTQDTQPWRVRQACALQLSHDSSSDVDVRPDLVLPLLP